MVVKILKLSSNFPQKKFLNLKRCILDQIFLAKKFFLQIFDSPKFRE